MGWKAALTLIAASAALGVSGCGGSSGSRSHSRTPAAAGAPVEATTHVTVTGCPAAQPRGIVPSPKEWIVDVRMCAARDGSSVLLTNISKVVVLEVRGVSGTHLQEQSGASAGESTSLADQTSAQVAPDGCLTQDACTLLPGHAILAMGSPATIDFAAVHDATVAVSAARAYATWTQEETEKGQQVARRIVTCAKLAGGAVPHARSWEEAYELASRRNSFCWRLVTTIMADAGTGERPEPRFFADIARRIDQGAWRDAMEYGTAHVAAG
jgi:hypothetical protein